MAVTNQASTRTDWRMHILAMSDEDIEREAKEISQWLTPTLFNSDWDSSGKVRITVSMNDDGVKLCENTNPKLHHALFQIQAEFGHDCWAAILGNDDDKVTISALKHDGSDMGTILLPEVVNRYDRLRATEVVADICRDVLFVLHAGFILRL